MPSGPVFENEKSIFFVMDEDDSTSDAGGCTQAWWDGQCPNGTEAEAAAAMAKLFDSTGTPIIDVSGVAYDDSEDEITITGAARTINPAALNRISPNIRNLITTRINVCIRRP